MTTPTSQGSAMPSKGKVTDKMLKRDAEIFELVESLCDRALNDVSNQTYAGRMARCYFVEIGRMVNRRKTSLIRAERKHHAK